MPNAATLGKSHPHRYDPLRPLADAIGSMTGAVAEQVANALHQVLEAATPQSRSARLQLIRHLVDIESQSVGVALLIDQNQLTGATVSIDVSIDARRLCYTISSILSISDRG